MPPKIQQPDRMELWRMYVRDGKIQSEIASHYGVGVATINRWLRGYGILSGRERKRKDERAAEPLPLPARSTRLAKATEERPARKIDQVPPEIRELARQAARWLVDDGIILIKEIPR